MKKLKLSAINVQSFVTDKASNDVKGGHDTQYIKITSDLPQSLLCQSTNVVKVIEGYAGPYC